MTRWVQSLLYQRSLNYTPNMPITHITSLTQLDGIISKSKDKLSVIDFHATWCGPCHAIAPTFETLSKQYAGVNFLKCDVDQAPDVAKRYTVSAMPTFIFLKGTTKVDQVRGANKAGLEAAVKTHSSGSSSGGTFAGRGQTLGGAPAAPDVVGEIKQKLDGFTGQLDPQLKVLFVLAGIYGLFWYFS
ncbi:thioredoxin-like protein [Crepidotus variabilis]|uniref:Thioredoxin-like protein n=1 Tax=Crepidotus variabilis TaxID=179855 RepID=A0A9P6ET42_9AGAR|nr:thioredoxin-like protein [Crepidotus variabilis]